MRDAFGGIVNIAIIVVFLVIVSGYLAYNVNYTKAFRVKNKIIDYAERYHYCNPQGDMRDACNSAVSEYMAQVGYSRDMNIGAPAGYTCGNGYCVSCRIANKGDEIDRKTLCYYDVITAVNVDIPVIDKIMPDMKLFQVSGSTKTFECPASSVRECRTTN